MNLAFKTNLTLDKADELWIGQQHLWNPYAVDVTRLFTPISALGVYYITYLTMKSITTFAGQYAIKVSYSKDKVSMSPCRNCCSSSESTISA